MRKITGSSFAIGLLFSLLLSTSAKAQECKECVPRPAELKGYVKADVMAKIYTGTTNITDLKYKYKGSDGANNYWRIFSDRVNNPIHATPNGLKKSRKLDFMDQVYVLDKSDNNWLKIAAYEPLEGEMTYVELGWVPVSNMLLTTHALSNNSSITKKGLVLINLDNVNELQTMTKAAENGAEIEKYMFYGDPLRRVKFGEERKLEIRYVLKEVKGVKLLSLNDKIDNLSAVNRKNNVNGWMKDLNVTDWDTRVCLETTYGQEYAEMYEGKKIPVFLKEDQLNSFTTLGLDYPGDAIYRLDITAKRKSNYLMRMPILKNYENSDLKEVATLGSVKTGGADESADSVITKAKEIIVKLKSKRNTINVLFVIDATSSMSKFYPAVRRGIENIIQLNKERYKKEMNFGVAVYRDYADGEKVFENIALTPDIQEVYNFLASVSIGSKGETRWESQYNGLIKGLDESRMKADESNVVVLIGDAGNKRTDQKNLTHDMVSKKLDEYNASLVTFQVVFGPQPAYGDFNDDAMDYLYKLGSLSDKKGDLIPNLNPVGGRSNSWELVFKDPNDGTTKTYLEGGFGRFIHANDNEAMPISILKENLTEAISEYLSELDIQLNNYTRIVNKGNIDEEGQNQYKEADLDNFKDYLREGGMSEEEIEVALQQFSKFSVRGYTRTRFYNQPLSCFAPVVFLSDEEVDNMVEVFDQVNPDATSSQAKLELYNGLKAQAKAALGETSDERVERLSLSDIWTVLLGVPFDEEGEYGSLKDVPIGDIPNSNHPMLPKFIIQFQQSVRLFNKSNLEQDRFKLNDQFYYWVPLEKIPGNG